MQKDKFIQRRKYRKVSKTALAIALCLVIFITNTGAISAADTPSSWATDEVNAAISEGFVPQNLQSNYTQAITRAEFAELAVALYENVLKGEITGRKTFVDTNDVNVQKAAFIGVVAGVGNDRFAPDDTLTREQAAVMLSRLANALSKPLKRNETIFYDNNLISDWAIDSVRQVAACGIMQGIELRWVKLESFYEFSPKTPYTREQSIVTIMRLVYVVRLTEESVYDAIMAMQSEYPEGMKWTDEDRYTSKGRDTDGATRIGGGCVALAFILSDAAFGDLPFQDDHRELEKLRVGDILHGVNYIGHCVIVLKIDGDTITVAEGNPGIYWGTTYSLDKLKQRERVYIETRWPTE